uniref:Immunoglobulin domain-containing protein n=1 Tax=Bos indicus x Bos taurus TaxID=30522 RepID=A0A4W2HBU1_BOBOX
PHLGLRKGLWTRLCFTGCLSLSGPRSVTGIVGGSMSVECQYQEAFVDDIKYWCKHPCVSPWKIVETRESEREVRRGRVSIRDRPASLTFTVTLESLREEDEGTYGCGIYVPLSRDPTFQVEVSVIPGGTAVSWRAPGAPASRWWSWGSAAAARGGRWSPGAHVGLWMLWRPLPPTA